MRRSSLASIRSIVQKWPCPGQPELGPLALVRRTCSSIDTLYVDLMIDWCMPAMGTKRHRFQEDSLKETLYRGGVDRGLWTQRMLIRSFASSRHALSTNTHDISGNTSKIGSAKKKKNPVLEDRSDTQSQSNAALLQSIRAIDFLPHIDALKKSKKVITYEELVKEFHLALPLASDEDAHAICEALAKSGSIIKMGDVIYLHPQEIAQTLRTVLPIDAPLLQKRLAVVDKLLEPMENIKAQIESHGMRRNRMISISFLGLLAAQWGIFFRLCYWELSWDVVEPIGFFANGLTTILSFAWFMQTRKDFSFEGMSHRVTSSYVQRKLEEENFNFVEYTRLKQEQQRLQESLSSIHGHGK